MSLVGAVAGGLGFDALVVVLDPAEDLLVRSSSVSLLSQKP
jgi:hypothetical protein